MGSDEPYKQADGTYLIPYADLRAAGLLEQLSGCATGGGTLDDSLRRIHRNAERMRWLVALNPETSNAK